MKFTVFKQKIAPGKAYMLRDDGKLFQCGQDIRNKHPYLLTKYMMESHNIVSDTLDALYEEEELQEQWIWLYSHINKSTQTLFNSVLSKLYAFAKQNNNSYAADLLQDMYHFKFNSNGDIQNIDKELLNLNNTINKEFCRVRVGDKYHEAISGDAYFRITPQGINWFNYIWQIVYDSKSLIETVTVCKDELSCGSEEVYSHNGIVFNKLPVNEFIELSGNPLVENLIKIE